MKHEKSCGCIVIRDEKVLLVKQNDGHWSFPKGHVEHDETEEQTAIREVKEETNVDVEVFENKRYEIEYKVDEDIDKTVVFFVAKLLGGELQRQESEIDEIAWMSFEDANDCITYENTKIMFEQVLKDEKLR